MTHELIEMFLAAAMIVAAIYIIEDKLKEVKEIRKKLKEEGYHQPLSWEQVKKAITYNWKQQKY